MTGEITETTESSHVCYSSVEDLFYLTGAQENLLRRLLDGLEPGDREIMVGIIQQFAKPNVF